MNICVSSDVGKIREINQDSYFYCENDQLPIFVVADGMGGHNAGEIASNLAIQIIKEAYNRDKEKIILKTLELPRFINEALKEANKRVFNESKKQECYQGMGTTITMGFIYEREIFIGHIGDSRAYLLRNEELLQLTQDHSLVAELVRNGSISQEEARNHPQKNIITRALGTDSNVNIDIVSRELEDKDTIILCTDGLTNMVSENRIREILLNCESLEDGCNTLIDTANALGGFDNSTVVIIKAS
ncbi:Stp1/IreP family PP2C-type Ser/Thr phosphatase [Brassicibacter mesophilus]|jgi:PPM family protein phosphatase|uniref:Stp1/IreP family PP2C-type Ser/Thr phosphatase n=1 Tax=Brassicibacter mesophilus TaxID=745119 RepID=UPI003D20BC03